eukprot:TRINITY_DN14153_c0_g1_i2.p1 TRINITY_DN14153_c0_g1~~TRINITY_DN14153_c0_g1_i2.p1  ORF type:complete len:812 (-),score=199.83 TRINITY_DN14153_c0_g1_i2:212-2647(-)
MLNRKHVAPHWGTGPSSRTLQPIDGLNNSVHMTGGLGFDDSNEVTWDRNSDGDNGGFAGGDVDVPSAIHGFNELESLLDELEGAGAHGQANDWAPPGMDSPRVDPGSPGGFAPPPQMSDMAGKKMKKMKDLIKNLKEKLKAQKREINALNYDNNRLQVELDGIQEENQQEDKDDLKALLNKAGTLGDEFDKKRREQAEARARREEARKKRIAVAGNEVDDSVLDQVAKGTADRFQGTCDLLLEVVTTRVKEFFAPFKREEQYMAARYGGGIGIYFTLVSNMFVTSMVVAVFWVGFWVLHLASGNSSSEPMASGSLVMPSSTLTSSIKSSEATHMIVVFIMSCLVLWISASIRYLRDDRAVYNIAYFEELETEEDDQRFLSIRMVREALNPWVFSVEDSGENIDQQSNLANRMKSIISEMERCKEREKRTPEQRRKLIFRRILGGFLNLVLIGLQWSAIIVLTIFTSTIQDAASGAGSLVAGVVVPLAISAINAALPLAIAAITEFDQWDSRAFRLKMEAGRLYVSRMFNVLIILLSYYQLLTQKTIYEGTEAKADTVNWGTCYEDQVSNAILLLVIADFFFPKAATLAEAWRENIMARHSAGLPLCSGKFIKQEFALAAEMIQLMYSQTLIWMLMPFYPFSALFMPLLHYLTFKFYKWAMVNYFEKPVGMDVGDTARSIAIMWLVTLMIASVAFAQWLQSPFVRTSGCSPFVSSGEEFTTRAASGELWALIGEDSGSALYVFLSSRYLYCFLFITALLWIGHTKGYMEGLNNFNDHKTIGHAARIAELEKDNKRLKHQKRMAEYMNSQTTS